METVQNPDVYGFTLFCEDIRAELGGKINFIGTYQSHMMVTEFPLVIPKFAFGISFFQRREVFIPNVKLLIFLPGDPDDKASIVADANEASPGIAAKTAEAFDEKYPDVEGTYVAARANFIVGGLTILQPGAIKVRAIHQNRMIRLGALTVLRHSEK